MHTRKKVLVAVLIPLVVGVLVLASMGFDRPWKVVGASTLIAGVGVTTSLLYTEPRNSSSTDSKSDAHS